MKFLIINKPATNEHDYSTDRDPAKLRSYAAQVKDMIDQGHILGAWVLHHGGHAYVIEAENSEDLAIKIRYNPLFKHSHTRVVPFEDAVVYLESTAKHLEQKGS